NSVIQEENSDGFTAVGGVDDFGGTDRGEIAVALIRNHDFARIGTRSGGCGCRRAPMGHLNVAYIKVVVGKYGRADGADEDSLVLQSEFLDGLCDQVVRNPVSATRTI